MAVASALSAQAGLKPYTELLQDRYAQARDAAAAVDPEAELTEEEQARFEIIRYCNELYEEARRAREPHETFDLAWRLYNGDMWPSNWQSWRAKITINKIRAYVTFMQAIMTDNKPRLSVEPLVPGSEDAADLLGKLVDRDWEENSMQQKLATFVLYGLIWGTSFMKITFDPYADGGRGKHLATPVVPYRVYTNRTTTCIEDAEVLIHIEPMTMGWVRRNFPDKAEAVYAVRGITSGDHEEHDRDYIREGQRNEQQKLISAQNVDGNIVSPQVSVSSARWHDADGDTCEVMECWLRDETREMYRAAESRERQSRHGACRGERR